MCSAPILVDVRGDAVADFRSLQCWDVGGTAVGLPGRDDIVNINSRRRRPSRPGGIDELVAHMRARLYITNGFDCWRPALHTRPLGHPWRDQVMLSQPMAPGIVKCWHC